MRGGPRVSLAGASSLHGAAGSVQGVTCHRHVPIGRSGTSTSWARWRWTTRGRVTTGSAPVGEASPAPAPLAPEPPVPPGSPCQSSSCPDFHPHPSFLEPWLVSSWLPCSSQQRLCFHPSGTTGFRSLCPWPHADTAPQLPLRGGLSPSFWPALMLSYEILMDALSTHLLSLAGGGCMGGGSHVIPMGPLPH